MEGHNDPDAGEHGRWFSHEVASETTVAQLVEYYSQFDDIEQIRLDVDSANARLLVVHILFRSDQGPKKLSTEKIVPKVFTVPQNEYAETSLTVYIDVLTPEITLNDLQRCFEKYGPIRTIRRPYNRQISQPEPYCFVQFWSKEAVNAVLAEYIHAIGDIYVTAKPAKARCKSSKHATGSFAEVPSDDYVHADVGSTNVFPLPAQGFGSISWQGCYTYSYQGITQVWDH